MKTISLAGLVLASVFASHAAQVTFTGVIDSNWFNRTNWSSLSIPAAGDDVVVTGKVVQVGANAQFRTLLLAGGALQGALPSSGDIRILEGSLAAGLEISQGQTLELDGAGLKFLTSSITNNGTIRWSGESNLLMAEGARIDNGPGGALILEGGESIQHFSGAAPVLLNHGNIRKTSTNLTAFSGVLFTNRALVDVQAGRLVLNNGVTSSGEFRVSEGARLELAAGDVNLEIPASFSGAGFYGVTGSVQVNGQITAPHFVIAGAVSGDKTIAGGVEWTSGSITGPTLVQANSTLRLSGEANKFLSAPSLKNHGEITIEGGGDLLMLEGVVFENGEPLTGSGRLIIREDRGLTHFSGATPVLVNRGTIQVSATNVSAFSGVSLTNHALVEVQSGNLNLPTGFTTHGEFRVSEGARLQLSGGSVILGSGARFTGPGFFGVTATVELDGEINSDNFQIAGTLSGTNSVSAEVDWTSGTISGLTTVKADGLLNIEGEANKFLSSAVFPNHGTVKLAGSGDLLVLEGARIENNGALEIHNDRSINHFSGERPVLINNGRLSKVSGTGIAAMNGVGFTTTGLVEVRTGVFNLPTGAAINGEINVSAGCSLTFSGGQIVLLPGANLTGAGYFGVTGTVELDGRITSDRFQIAGTLSGTNAVAADVEWTSGSIVGPTTVEASGNLTLAGDANKFLSSTHLQNDGLVRIEGAGDLLITASSIHNEGEIQLRNGRGLRHFSGETPVLVNDGLIHVSSDGASALVGLAFTNNALVQVQAGVLDLPTGMHNRGEMSVAADASITFSGGRLSLEPPAKFTGAGFYGVTGTVDVSGDIPGANFRIQGLLTGTNAISGTAVWSEGSISSDTTIRPGGTLRISSDNLKFLTSGTLRNQGTIQWTGGGILQSTATIRNEATGSFLIETAEDLRHFSGELPLLVNYGLLRRSGPGDDTTIHGNFTNHATVEILGGGLDFNQPYTQAGGHTKVQGSLTAPNVVIESGGLSGGGVIHGNLSNRGVITTSPADGRLTVRGGFEQTSAGGIIININGVDADSFGLAITGTAHLGGTLTVNFVDGFVPGPGTYLELLSYVGRFGEFSQIDGLGLLNGRAWQVVGGAREYYATLARIFDAGFAADGAFTLEYRGPVGGQYQVLTSTDLSAWEPYFTTNTLSGVVTFRDADAVNHPRRFYRIRPVANP